MHIDSYEAFVADVVGNPLILSDPVKYLRLHEIRWHETAGG